MLVMCFHKTVALFSAYPRFIKINSKSFSNLRKTKLVEIGHLEKLTTSGINYYKRGQLFIHKLFGYRGLILFSWFARMYGRDVDESTFNDNGNDKQSPDWTKTKDEDGRVETFYNVLIDERDCPFIRGAHLLEAVTFFANSESRRDLFAIPGLDYVWHYDVLPYTSSGEEPPFRHELLNQFMSRQVGQEPPYVAQDTLIAWRAKNRPWLQLTEVHKETTEGVQVTVIPFYMGSRSSSERGLVHWWRCHVSLVNLSQLAVLVLGRHWQVLSEGGTLESIRGRGIDGHQLLLTHSMPAFQYSCNVGLTSTTGNMWGSFQMQNEDGLVFECRLPHLSLHNIPPNKLGQVDE